MDDRDELRRRILRQAVRENVNDLANLPPAGLRRSRRLLRLSMRALGVVVVPLALFVSINAFSNGETRPEVVLVSEKAAPTPAPQLGALRAPKRIDPSVFRLDVAKVVLDPGHGGSDPGALTPDGLTEKQVTLDVARRVKGLLEEARYTVVMTRDGDRNVSLRERALFANAAKGDLFLSIHVNSIPTADRRGVETYFLGASEDPHVVRLAGEENRESGYALSDFKRLLEEIYVDVRQSESKKLATAVQGSLFGSLRKVNPGLEDRGVKQAPFVVLVASEMPGILAEISCISNDEEARRLADPAYRQSIARALVAGIEAYTGGAPRPQIAAGELPAKEQ